MYPIKFENLYYDKVWGGRDLEDFRENLPEGNIGESWDIACHENGTGIVANGKFKGMTFKELIEKYNENIFGNAIKNNEFPLLVKLINSNENLSVQVHPNDEYARRVENSFGKTEAWHVVDAKEGAELIVGTNGCTKEQFEEAIKNNSVEDCLNRIKVKKGDAFLINSGLVHAICSGLVIAEIQQNSDITYRVYDYGRPREIHVEKSLAVIDFNLKAENLSNKEVVKFDGFSKVDFCENEYFGMQKINVETEWSDCSNEEKFFILTCVDGCGTIEGDGFSEEVKIGDSYLIPATLGDYIVKGNLAVIKSYPM